MLDSRFNKIDLYVWHLRLGHINKNKMKRIHEKGIIPNMQDINFKICPVCVQEKLSRKSFTKHWHSFELVEVIHMDICEPFRVKTHRGMNCFIEGYFIHQYVYFSQHKSKALEKFK